MAIQRRADAMGRVPVAEDAGIRLFFCGPESFTHDIAPMVGPVPEVDGMWWARTVLVTVAGSDDVARPVLADTGEHCGGLARLLQHDVAHNGGCLPVLLGVAFEHAVALVSERAAVVGGVGILRLVCLDDNLGVVVADDDAVPLGVSGLSQSGAQVGVVQVVAEALSHAHPV